MTHYYTIVFKIICFLWKIQYKVTVDRFTNIIIAMLRHIRTNEHQ